MCAMKMNLNPYKEITLYTGIHMDQYKKDIYLVESDMQLEDGTWYCVPCNKTLKIGHVDRHLTSNTHKQRDFLYRYEDFRNQVSDRFDSSLNTYRPNGNSYIDKYEYTQMYEKMINEYDKAFVNGYFNEIQTGGKINFGDYDIYQRFCEKHGYNSLHPEDNE